VDTWGVAINSGAGTITFTAPTSGTGYIAANSIIQILIGNNASSGSTGSNQIVNPASVNSYLIDVTITNAVGQESAQISVPIVDSDQVNVTSYINTFLSFDLDTAVANLDCDYNTCKLFGDSGASGANYTVDLGELNATYVNKSNSVAVVHSDGNSGVINSIYFNLTTNAWGGAVVNVTSTNGALQGPDANKILSVTNDGDPIVANSGLYGFTMPNTATGNGTVIRNSACTLGTAFCKLVTTPNVVFNTNGRPLDNGRIRLDLAAAAAYTNNPGTYTDTLTFIAVPTY
jgi:hypothetical protein